MSESDNVDDVLVVFNCMTCGAMLSVNNHTRMMDECSNCGAAYDLSDSPDVRRYYRGRPPTQWKNNGWDGDANKAEGVH